MSEYQVAVSQLAQGPLSAPPTRGQDGPARYGRPPAEYARGRLAAPPPRRSASLSHAQRTAALARVAEKRYATQSGFWGHAHSDKTVRRARRDLPAFWSLSSHGQPFNDERLTEGSSNHFKVVEPPKLGAAPPRPVGPATESLATLKTSLQSGVAMFGGDRQMTPVDVAPDAASTLRKSTELFRTDPDAATQAWGDTSAALQAQHGLRTLSDAEREMLVSRLPPHYMIHALAHCLDRDERAADFLPWTAAYHAAAGRAAWLQDRSQCLRLGTQALLAMMRAHLVYMSGEECRRARAPYTLPKDMLRNAFWRVDPRRSGYVSLPQFMQVWQNILQLWEYDTAERVVRGAVRRALVPRRRRVVDRNAAAALFAKFGFDRAGHLPYDVFIHALNESPSRLLGHGLLLNKTLTGRNGVENLVDVALLIDDAKVDYPKSAMGVFPPSGFDERLALRSMRAPRAHMWLEHVYGYAGFSNLANNLFFTANTAGAFNEVVYYAGMLGVVATWVQGDEAFGVRQRFFFGHDNDIMCLAAHPNRRFVATGQQTSTAGRPYACVWDIGQYSAEDAAQLASGDPERMRGVGAAREPVQLQRLEVDKSFRSILAVAFSGDPHASAGRGEGGGGRDARGGELLVTLCGDNHHTVHVWRWMVPAELCASADKKLLFSHCKAMYIPSWHFGPEKKLAELAAAHPYYCGPDGSGPQRYVPEEHNTPGRHLDLVADEKSDLATVEATRAAVTELLEGEAPVATLEGHPLVRKVLHKYARPRMSRGFAPLERPAGAANSKCEKVGEFASAQGTPPTVYGAVFNPLRPSIGRGCEFLTYGIKHLKTWVFDDDGRWRGTAATFGPDRVQNVLCAAFVPAQHAGRAPGDSCIVTGFPDGSLGLWLPPFPTVAGARYALCRTLRAHSPGPLMTMIDGLQQYGGVKCLTVCARPRAAGASAKRARDTFLLSGGADGTVRRWHLRPPPPSGNPRAPPPRGAALVCGECDAAAGCVCGDAAAARIREPCLPDQGEVHPMVRGLDWHPSHPENAFIVGTSGCDIWHVAGRTQRAVLDGHSAAVHMVAPHPADATRFVTADESGTVLKYNTESRLLEGRTVLGFRCYAVAISNEQYSHEQLQDTWRAHGPRFAKCWHIAVSGRKGRIMILKWDDFQPLANIPAKGTKEGVCDLKFTPAGAPTPLLAAASHDQNIYIYNVAKGYQLQAVCSGSSGTVEHLDWSYAVVSGPLRMHGRYILQSNDASREVLHWDGLSGRKVTSNQRDALWATWTCTMGFPVLGVWPDFSDGTDVNAVARSACGAPVDEPLAAADPVFHTRRPRPATKGESADGVPGAHVIATADDFSFVKLFNGPVVADDAPYRAYRGHASHVTCVRFAHDDRRLFSVGGIDRCVFQWRTIGVNVDDRAVDAHVLNAVEEAALRKHQRDNANVPLPRQDGAESWLRDDSMGATTFRRRLDQDCLQLSSFRRSLDESLQTRHLNRTLSVQKPVPPVDSDGVTL